MREGDTCTKWKRRGQSHGMWEEVEPGGEDGGGEEEEEEREAKLMNLILGGYF